MHDTEDGEQLFARMIACGDRLIEAQGLEASLGRSYSKHRRGFEEWQESRRWVEGLAAEYAAAVRAWRESIEVEVARQPSPRTRYWRPSCRALAFWRKVSKKRHRNMPVPVPR